MIDPKRLLALAERCELEEPSIVLDVEIAMLLRDGYAPPYTCSIDAAAALVPKGHSWTVGRLADGRCYGAVGNPYESWAKTPALALTASALKALADPDVNDVLHS